MCFSNAFSGCFFRTVCGQGLPQREKERELAQEARNRRVEGEGEKGKGGKEGGREGEREGDTSSHKSHQLANRFARPRRLGPAQSET